VWVHFDTRKQGGAHLRVFAQPISLEAIQEMKSKAEKEQIQYEQSILSRKEQSEIAELEAVEEPIKEISNLEIANDLEKFRIEAISRMEGTRTRTMQEGFGGLLNDNFGGLIRQLEGHIKLLHSNTEISPEHHDEITRTSDTIRELLDESTEELIARSEIDTQVELGEAEQSGPYLAKHTPDPDRLLVLDVRVTNFLDGEPVDRVEDITIKNSDRWIIKHSIEVKENVETKMEWYLRMRARLLIWQRDNSRLYNSSFMQQLLKISEMGKKYRDQKDAKSRKKKPMLFRPYDITVRRPTRARHLRR
jgi:hypothetical protein